MLDIVIQKIYGFPNSNFARDEASQLDPLTLTFNFIVFYICLSVRCLFVALLKATYAENLDIVLS